MSTEQPRFATFEQFWLHFLSSHLRSSTRWAHVAALGAGLAGAGLAWRSRKAWPLAAGVGAGVALALGAHPLLEGNTAENLGTPLWSARALVRMCLRTVTGSIDADLAALAHERAEAG
jgi:hypothetical protein